MTEEEKKEPRLVSRRSFLRGASAAVVGGVVAAPLFPASAAAESTTIPAGAPEGATTLDAPQAPSEKSTAVPARVTYPASTGYLVVDNKKCAGCLSCMVACSTAHEGQPNPSLSRIQITQDRFLPFPNDLQQNQCRQCSTPVCVQNCPTGACHVDTANGNVRVIDQTQCIGCQTCLSACPQTPHRTIWNPVTKKASKCDLCLNTPYWDEQGGPTGKQACVDICPMQAIKLVAQTPSQMDTVGYNVNLRNAKAAAIFLDLD